MQKARLTLLLLICLALLGACEYDPFPRCVAADDFGNPILTISSSRSQGSTDFRDDQGNDSGEFSPNQVIRWQDTGFVTNGTEIIVRTNGYWTAWLSTGKDFDLLEVIKTNPVKTNFNSDKYKGTDSNQLIKGSAVSLTRFCGPYAKTKPKFTGNASETCDFISDEEPKDDPRSGVYGAPCWFNNGYGAYLLLKRPNDPDPNRTLQLMRYPVSPVTHIGYQDGEEGGSGSFSTGDKPLKDSSGNAVKIEPGWKIYAKILDRYYWDNAGGYSIEFLSGAQKLQTSTVFETVRREVQKDLLNATKAIFERIAQNEDFINFVRAVIVLFIIFSALAYMLGTIQQAYSDILIRIIKAIFILALISPGSWELFYNHLFVLFVDGLNGIIAIINSHSGATYNPEEPFYFIDYMIQEKIFSPTVWNIKIKALVATNFGGIFWALVVCLVVIAYLLTLCYAFIIYLVALVGLSLLMSIFPIVFLGILFEKLKPMFDTWITQCISFSMQAIMIFTLVSLFSSMIMSFYYRSLGFTVCHNDFIIFDFGILGKTTVKNWTAGQEFSPATVGFVFNNATYSDLGGNRKYNFTQGAGVIPVPPEYITRDYRYLDFPFLDPDPTSKSRATINTDGLTDNNLKKLIDALSESKNTFSAHIVARKAAEAETLLNSINLPAGPVNNFIRSLIAEAHNVASTTPQSAKLLLGIALEQIKRSNNLLTEKEQKQFDAQGYWGTMNFVSSAFETAKSTGKLDANAVTAYVSTQFASQTTVIALTLSQITQDPDIPMKYKTFANDILNTSIKQYSTADGQKALYDNIQQMSNMLNSNAVFAERYKALNEANNAFATMFARIKAIDEVAKSPENNNYTSADSRYAILIALGKAAGLPEASKTHATDAFIDGSGYDYHIIETQIKQGNLIIYGELFGMLVVIILLIHLRVFVQRVGATIAGGSPFINIIGDQFQGMFDPRGSGIGAKIGALFAGLKYKYQDAIGGKIDSLQDKAVRSVPGLKKFTDSAAFLTSNESRMKEHLRNQETFKELQYGVALIGTHLRNPAELAKLAGQLAYDTLTSTPDPGGKGTIAQMKDLAQMQHKVHIQKLHDLIIGYKPPKPSAVLDPTDKNNPFKEVDAIRKFGELEYNPDGTLRIDNEVQRKEAVDLRDMLTGKLAEQQKILDDPRADRRAKILAERELEELKFDISILEKSLSNPQDQFMPQSQNPSDSTHGGTATPTSEIERSQPAQQAHMGTGEIPNSAATTTDQQQPQTNDTTTRTNADTPQYAAPNGQPSSNFTEIGALPIAHGEDSVQHLFSSTSPPHTPTTIQPSLGASNKDQSENTNNAQPDITLASPTHLGSPVNQSEVASPSQTQSTTEPLSATVQPSKDHEAYDNGLTKSKDSSHATASTLASTMDYNSPAIAPDKPSSSHSTPDHSPAQPSIFAESSKTMDYDSPALAPEQPSLSHSTPDHSPAQPSIFAESSKTMDYNSPALAPEQPSYSTDPALTQPSILAEPSNNFFSTQAPSDSAELNLFGLGSGKEAALSSQEDNATDSSTGILHIKSEESRSPEKQDTAHLIQKQITEKKAEIARKKKNLERALDGSKHQQKLSAEIAALESDIRSLEESLNNM